MASATAAREAATREDIVLPSNLSAVDTAMVDSDDRASRRRSWARSAAYDPLLGRCARATEQAVGAVDSALSLTRVLAVTGSHEVRRKSMPPCDKMVNCQRQDSGARLKREIQCTLKVATLVMCGQPLPTRNFRLWNNPEIFALWPGFSVACLPKSLTHPTLGFV